MKKTKMKPKKQPEGKLFITEGDMVIDNMAVMVDSRALASLLAQQLGLEWRPGRRLRMGRFRIWIERIPRR